MTCVIDQYLYSFFNYVLETCLIMASLWHLPVVNGHIRNVTEWELWLQLRFPSVSAREGTSIGQVVEVPRFLFLRS